MVDSFKCFDVATVWARVLLWLHFLKNNQIVWLLYISPHSTRSSSFISSLCFSDHSVALSVMAWPWEFWPIFWVGRVFWDSSALSWASNEEQTCSFSSRVKEKNPSRFKPYFKLSGNSMSGAVGDLCCTSPAPAPCCPPLVLSPWIKWHHGAIAAAWSRRERHGVLLEKALESWGPVVLKARRALVHLYPMISV